MEAKGLLGADLFVTSPAPLTAPVVDYIGALGANAREQTFSSMMSFPRRAGSGLSRSALEARSVLREV